MPFALAAALAAFCLHPAVQAHPAMRWSFLGAAGTLAAWSLLLATTAARRKLAIQVVLRPQHYVQACVNGSIFLYWGYYWRTVYDNFHLIVAQLVFAYAFDALLTWSRRDTWTVGFGPLPIVFSTNLFLWFKPDWFYLQFLMVGVGFAAKELIRWTKDGRRVHIFNPSSFTLSVFSLGLILTGTTSHTWGNEIASTQFYPPHCFLWIFLVAIPVQYLFGVASMTLSAVATIWGFNMAHRAVTGETFFIDVFIPIGVFLGTHLLFTDPSTAPRTDLGRIVFGILYGLSVVGLYALLGESDVPTFYDKLLGVPLLNLSIQRIDRLARSRRLRDLDPGAWLERLLPGRRNLAYMALWAALFATMYGVTRNPAEQSRADILLEDGRPEAAIERYRALLARVPDHPAAHANLGYALVQVGREDEAMPLLRRALELDPQDAEAQTNLGLTLMRLGEANGGVLALRRAAELEPANEIAHLNLATALVASGELAAAVDSYGEALRLRPDSTRALAALAWIQATHATVRAPEEALRLASRAVELTGRRDIAALDALAAAYAGLGRFEQAVETARAAERLAARSAPDAVEAIRSRIRLYSAGRPLVIR